MMERLWDWMRGGETTRIAVKTEQRVNGLHEEADRLSQILKQLRNGKDVGKPDTSSIIR